MKTETIYELKRTDPNRFDLMNHDKSCDLTIIKTSRSFSCGRSIWHLEYDFLDSDTPLKFDLIEYHYRNDDFILRRDFDTFSFELSRSETTPDQWNLIFTSGLPDLDNPPRYRDQIGPDEGLDTLFSVSHQNRGNAGEDWMQI